MSRNKTTERIEREDPDAFEWAVRLMYEQFKGEGSWRRASTAARSHARQALRNAMSRLEGHGWFLQPAAPLRPPLRLVKPATARAAKG